MSTNSNVQSKKRKRRAESDEIITRPTPKRSKAEVSQPRPDYDALKQWIAAREAYESSTSKVAPLTATQRKFFQELKSPGALLLPQEEPDVGETDWVGILQSTRRPPVSRTSC